MINVLVVEDDPMVAQLHEHYLSFVISPIMGM